MDQNRREELEEEFEENIAWLRSVIPPDDIYAFAEEALMAAHYFLLKIQTYVDLEKEAKADKTFNVWFKNVLLIRMLRMKKYDGIIESRFKTFDEL